MRAMPMWRFALSLELGTEPSAEPHVTKPRRETNRGAQVMRRLMIMLLGVLAYRTLAKQNRLDHHKAMG